MFYLMIILIGFIIIHQAKPEDIDVKTKDDVAPIDIAVIHGSLEIYTFLVNNNAMVTSDTIIACCSDGRYRNIKNWTERIRALYCCEKASPESKMSIFVDLQKRYIMH